MAKLLMNCWVSHEYDYCNYAVIDLTPELAALILQRKATLDAAHAADKDVIEVAYWDYSPMWLDALPESVQDVLDYGEDFAEISAPDEDFENVAARTECDRMVINDHDVYWECIPKHTDVRAETRPIDYDTVRAALAPVEVVTNAR